jgi:hypothetical protein
VATGGTAPVAGPGAVVVGLVVVGLVVVVPAGLVGVVVEAGVVVVVTRVVVVVTRVVVGVTGAVVEVVAPGEVVEVVAPGGVVVGTSTLAGPTTNQLLGSERSAANCAPVRPTEPEAPVTETCSTRPPIRPRPLRRLTSIDSQAPIEGNTDSSRLTGTGTVQL